jgi:hypothetical protein
VFAAPPGNPLTQILYMIGGAVLLIGAVVMGAVILAFVIGFALILGLVLWVRVWWLRRKLRPSPGQRVDRGNDRSGSAGDGGVEITEVEYHVVRESRSDDERT